MTPQATMIRRGPAAVAQPIPDYPQLDGPEMVRRFRLEIGLSQNQLAKQAGIDAAYVNRIERRLGNHSPSRAVLLKLIDVLGLDLDTGDRLLYAFGYAGRVDWQMAWEQVSHDVTAAVEAAVVKSMARVLSLYMARAEPPPDDEES